MENLVPKQEEGKQLDLKAENSLENEDLARNFFKTVKKRLLHAYEWYDVAEIPAASFVLTDEKGREILREMKEGDLLKIDIPGPGTSAGHGYDWVYVEEIHHAEEPDYEFCSVTLRPTSNPTGDDSEIAHFFKNMATSTLMVSRKKNVVIAEYHGRNEVINMDLEKVTDKIRNMLVGIGAKFGMSFSQWKSLTEGLVSNDK